MKLYKIHFLALLRLETSLTDGALIFGVLISLFKLRLFKCIFLLIVLSENYSYLLLTYIVFTALRQDLIVFHEMYDSNDTYFNLNTRHLLTIIHFRKSHKDDCMRQSINIILLL